jgi:ubiquinone biosynthesis protein COQ4
MMNAQVSAVDARTQPRRETTVVRWAKTMLALARLVRDPDDTQQVFEMGERVNGPTHRRLLGIMEASEGGRWLLRTQPTINTQTLEQCQALASGTVGRAYADFMQAHHLSPELFQAPERSEGKKTRYVEQRMRQTHDLWHVLTGYGTDVPGELELQAFTFGQTGSPMSALIVFGGLTRFWSKTPALLGRVRRAYRRGQRSAPLVQVPWERRWQEPLASVCVELIANA